MSIVHMESWKGLSLRHWEAAFIMQSRLHSEWFSVARQMTLFRRRRKDAVQRRRKAEMYATTEPKHAKKSDKSSKCKFCMHLNKSTRPFRKKTHGGEKPTTQDILTMQMCLNHYFCICRPKLLHLQTGAQNIWPYPTMPHVDRNWMKE